MPSIEEFRTNLSSHSLLHVKHLLLLLLILFQACATPDSIFKLSPQQSMSITGKGPGQDATINPYTDGTSFALIKNLGDNKMTARVKYQGENTEKTILLPGEKKKIKLLKGAQLFLDSQDASKARVTFKESND